MKKLIPGFCVLLLIMTNLLFASGSTEEIINLAYPRSVSSIVLMELVEQYPEEYSGELYTDHPQALARLINGETDILASGFTVGYSRYSAAGDVRLAATFVWGVSSIMTAEPIESWEDLAGTTLYSPFEGSPIDIQIKAVLDLHGLSDSIELAYAPFPQAAALLAQGKAGAAVLVDPIASSLEAGGKAYRFQTIQESYAEISGGELRSPQVSIFTMADYTETDLPEIKRLIRRVKSIQADVLADIPGIAEKYSDFFQLPAKVIEAAVQNALFTVVSAEEERDLIELYIDIMKLKAPADNFYTAR